jgi:hypothetical protein
MAMIYSPHLPEKSAHSLSAEPYLLFEDVQVIHRVHILFTTTANYVKNTKLVLKFHLY